MRNLINAGFALVLAVLLGTSVLLWWNVRRLIDNDYWVAHTHEVLAELEEYLSVMKDAETGTRGYLLTARPKFLGPYQVARQRIPGQLERLRRLTADNPDQQEALHDLSERTEAKLADLEDNVRRRDRPGWTFDGPENDRLAADKDKMDAIREAVARMKEREEALLHRRARESDTSAFITRCTLVGSALLMVVVLGMAYGLVLTENSRRRRAAEALAGEEAARAEARAAREAEAQLQELAQQLRRSNAELEQFASVASHDLQEPLRKIQAFGDRLRSRCADALGAEGADHLARMLNAAGRMRVLIDDLLSFSRVATKAQPFAPVDLAAAARDVVSDLEGRLQQTGGSVEVGELPQVEADPMQVRQLFQNLLGNALKFHRPGVPPVVRLSGRLREADGDPPVCELTVADNGIGFDEKYLDRIFNVFQRLHGRNEYEGSGIGLAICRKIVERHGGAITARSAPGAGATFLITLPARRDPGEPTRDEVRPADHDPDGRR